MATSNRSNCGSCAQILLTSISLVEFFYDRPVLLRIDLPLRLLCGHGKAAVFHIALRPQKQRRELCCAMQGIMPPSTIRGESNPFEMSFASRTARCDNFPSPQSQKFPRRIPIASVLPVKEKKIVNRKNPLRLLKKRLVFERSLKNVDLSNLSCSKKKKKLIRGQK